MELFIRYILISTSCLGILYIGYLVFQRKDPRFYQLRYFLLISMVLSLLIPFSTFQIDLNLSPDKYWIEEIYPETVNSIALTDGDKIIQTNNHPEQGDKWSVTNLLLAIYFIGLSFFSLRLLIQLIKILYLFGISKKIQREKIVLLNNKNISPFTFFNWIFIPADHLKKGEYKDIITHERIHASQYHSIDLILIELLSAVMWFNPLVWMMKKSVQLVHEYLADEGVLKTGTDKLKYQALLLNQVAEERLICLSSNFNHSLIKKRMIMMTKNKFNKRSKFGILTLMPLAAILIIGVACINGEESKNEKVFTVVIDSGHGGRDTGAKLNEKISEKDLTLAIVKVLKEKTSSNSKLNFVFTREKDEFLPLDKRIAKDANLFISIHSNYSKNSDVSGIECFIAKESDYKTESENIGKLVVSELGGLEGIETSLKEANFIVLKESECPALLLNIGYMSNPNDLSFITDEYNQGLICDKILNVINQLN